MATKIVEWKSKYSTKRFKTEEEADNFDRDFQKKARLSNLLNRCYSSAPTSFNTFDRIAMSLIVPSTKLELLAILTAEEEDETNK